MKAITDTNIDITATVNGDDGPVSAAEQGLNAQHGSEDNGQSRGKPESELRAAARRRGLSLKELASLMGVNYGHLCSVANGRRPWTPMMTERATAVLGEVPGQGVVYRRGGPVQGESTGIREQARAQGLSQRELADLVGVSATYMSQVARGRRTMSPQVQARVEAALKAPARIEPAVCANRPDGVVSGGSTCIREQAPDKGMYGVFMQGHGG